MHTTLYLTPAEQKAFAALPPSLRDGWSVDPEVLRYADSPAHRQVRVDLMELEDTRFEDIVRRCGPHCSAGQLQELTAHVDLTTLGQHDLWEIFFALGPDVLGDLISALLARAATDADVEGVLALTHLRHELLVSLTSR